MKSSFDQEIQRLMQENVFDNIASGTWSGIKAVGSGLGTAAKTATQAAWGLSGGREALSNIKQAGSNIKQGLMGPSTSPDKQSQQQNAQTPGAAPGRTLKSIANIDNKIRDTLNSSGLTPSDKAVLQAQIPALIKGLSTNVTDQDLISIITTALMKR